MSDQTNAVGFTGDGQPSEPSPKEEPKPTQPEVLTPDQEKFKDDVSETVFRRVQGLLDRQTEHLSKLQAEQAPAPEPSKKPAKVPKGEQEVDPVTADGWRIMDDAGVQIEKNDPEAALLAEARTPREYFLAVETAIETKRQRTSTEPKEEEGATPPRTPTNLGGSGAPTPKATVDDYKKEMYAARGQGAVKGREIKDKYRKLGVEVDVTVL